MSVSKATRRKPSGGPGPGLAGEAKSEGRSQSLHVAHNLSKLWTPHEDWDRDEFGDVVYWMRQVLGLACGVIWGLIPLVGGIWLLLFVGLNAGLVFLYYTQVLCVDDEDFGGHTSIVQEGFLQSFALFLKTSTVLYPFTVRHMALRYKESGDSLMINDQDIQSVVLVGKVGQMETRTTDMAFVLDDGTGKIEVRKWHDDHETEVEKMSEVQTGKYVKVHGVPRKIGPKYTVSANSIRVVTDYDEYTCHYLDSIFAYQYSNSLHGGKPAAPDFSGQGHGAGAVPGQTGPAPHMGAMKGASNGMASGSGGSGLGAAAAAADSRLPIHERVLKYFTDNEGSNPEGVHRDTACRNIPGLSTVQVLETIEFLVSEGHLYSTIDDVHFKTLGENQ